MNSTEIFARFCWTHIGTLSVALCGVATATAGCTESRPGVVDPSASIQVEPESLTFAAPLLDGGRGAATRTIRPLLLTNTGGGVLTVKAISIREDDDSEELGLLFDLPAPEDRLAGGAEQVTEIDLCPDPADPAGGGAFKLERGGMVGSQCVVLVTFEAIDARPDRARIFIRSSDVGDAERIVEVETLAGGPRLVVDPPGELLFEREVDGAPGVPMEPERKLIRLSNAGTDELVLHDFELINDAGGDFAIEIAADSPVGSLPATLGPQDARERLDLWVTYAPTRPGVDQGELRIRSNDPTRPELVIHLTAKALAKCVMVTPLDVDFRQVQLGDNPALNVDITNCGTVDVGIPQVGFVVGSHVDFRIDQVPDGFDDACLGDAGLGGEAVCSGGLAIPPGGTRSVALRYAPSALGAAGGQLAIHTDSPSQPLIVVNLFGRAVDNLPPRAVAEARTAGAPDYQIHADEEECLQVFPASTVELRGSMSSDPEGGALRHKWSLLQAPDGAVTRFLPQDGAPDPTLFIPVSGIYLLELQVTDPVGNSDSAAVCVEAIAHGCVHVELTWNTPGDADESDVGFGAGSDVDLHLLHPLGDWGEAARDCHFRSPNPDWGRPFDPTDDPTLDIDDTDGGGPENVTLDQCEDNRNYRIGVHYFDDHGYGPAFATVSIFVDGVMRAQFANQRLGRTDDFWDVATVSSGGAVVAINEMFAWP